MKTFNYTLRGKENYIKFLYFTDPHHSGVNPEGRIDNFPLAILRKIEEIKDYANKNNIDFIKIGGDFFNSYTIADGIFNQICSLYQKFEMPIFLVPGGHDLNGNNIDSIDKTKIGICENFRLLNIIRKNEVHIFDKNGLKIQLTGQPSEVNLDKNKEAFILKYKEPDVKYAIHTIHGMLLKEKVKGLNTYVPLDYVIQNTVADITFGGHYHLGFETICKDGKWFCNPGALCRKIAVEEEINRIPSFVEVTISDKGIKLKEIPLKSAEAGFLVLSREKIEQNNANEEKMIDFKQQIRDFNEHSVQGNDLNEVVKNIANINNFDEEVIKEAIKRLDSAFSSLESAFVINKTKPVYIKKVIMHNFLTHKFSVFEFDENLNVLIGESGNGKSNAIRAIIWVLFNEPDGDDYVTIGEEECSVTIITNEDVEVERKRIKDKNYYALTLNGQIYSFDGFGRDVPIKIIEETGIHKALMTKTLKYNLNYQDQNDEPFLILDTNGGNKAKVMSTLTRTNHFDEAIKITKNDSRIKLNEYNTAKETLANKMKEAEQYSNLKEEEEIIKEIETNIAELSISCSELETVVSDKNRLIEINEEINDNKHLIDNSELLNNIEKEIKKLELLESNYKSLKDKQTKLTKLIKDYEINKKNITENKNILLKLKNLDVINKELIILKNLKDKEEDLKKVKKKYNDLAFTNRGLEYYRTMLIRLFSCDKIETMITNASNENNKLLKAKQHLQDLKEKNNMIDSIKDNIDILNNNKKIVVESYVEKIKDLGTCPVCSSKIDEKHIKQLEKELF